MSSEPVTEEGVWRRAAWGGWGVGVAVVLAVPFVAVLEPLHDRVRFSGPHGFIWIGILLAMALGAVFGAVFVRAMHGEPRRNLAATLRVLAIGDVVIAALGNPRGAFPEDAFVVVCGSFALAKLAGARCLEATGWGARLRDPVFWLVLAGIGAGGAFLVRSP